MMLKALDESIAHSNLFPKASFPWTMDEDKNLPFTRFFSVD